LLIPSRPSGTGNELPVSPMFQAYKKFLKVSPKLIEK